MERKKILITNDDGVDQPGIYHLWNALKDRYDVTITAPAFEQSGVGLCVTSRKPLELLQAKWPESANVWSVNGTPADCIKLALTYVMPQQPDLIVSGINRGSNSGRNVFYSGTIAGVIEGILHDIPGIAFSCADFYDTDYLSAKPHVEKLVNHIFEHPLPTGTFLNVNFPSHETGKIKGIKLARQGKQYWAENPGCRPHPLKQNPYYWIGAQIKKFDEHEESDIAWLDKGYAAAVPIHVGEMTDHKTLEDRKQLFEDLLS